MRKLLILAAAALIGWYLLTPPLGSGDPEEPDVCSTFKRICITNIKRTCLDTTDDSPKASLTFRVRPRESEQKAVPGSWGQVNSSRGIASVAPGQERSETVIAEGDDLDITISSLNPTVEIYALTLSAFATCP